MYTDLVYSRPFILLLAEIPGIQDKVKEIEWLIIAKRKFILQRYNIMIFILTVHSVSPIRVKSSSTFPLSCGYPWFKLSAW
jgi:hypothetical protein